MYKCKNCEFKGKELSVTPLKDKCPVCGDEVFKLETKDAKPVVPVEVIGDDIKDADLDLNGDGVVDEKDASIAGKVMASVRQTKNKK